MYTEIKSVSMIRVNRSESDILITCVMCRWESAGNSIKPSVLIRDEEKYLHERVGYIETGSPIKTEIFTSSVLVTSD